MKTLILLTRKGLIGLAVIAYYMSISINRMILLAYSSISLALVTVLLEKLSSRTRKFRDYSMPLLIMVTTITILTLELLCRM